MILNARISLHTYCGSWPEYICWFGTCNIITEWASQNGICFPSDELKLSKHCCIDNLRHATALISSRSNNDRTQLEQHMTFPYHGKETSTKHFPFIWNVLPHCSYLMGSLSLNCINLPHLHLNFIVCISFCVYSFLISQETDGLFLYLFK